MSKPIFFAQPAAFHAWLATHHADSKELLVGYWKKATGKPSVTWEETVDEALCFGWIDGVRRRIDEESFSVRFTPRREGSVWSQRNLDRIEVLRSEGRLQPEGLAVWEARRPERSGYSYETRARSFPPAMKERMGDAWTFHAAQAPSYQQAVVDWVRSAKQDATQQRRLAAVIAAAQLKQRVNLARPFDVLDD